MIRAAVAILASICAAAAVPAIMGAPSEYRVGNFGSVHTPVVEELLFDEGEWKLLLLPLLLQLLAVVLIVGEETCRTTMSSPPGEE